ncbi:hypothetical protein BJY00DRAFT_285497 [Aspergillus carlsbadensis]|nr:hypothetical protein BJY00DRAFT_285497 [Aspergillus carlsbadensis]
MLPAIGPSHCANETSWAPNLYPPNGEYYCFVPRYQNWNTTQQPLDTLRGCCDQVNATVGFYGAGECSAVCNVTDEEAQAVVEGCLLASDDLATFGCALDNGVGGRVMAPVAGWGVWVVVGLVLGSLVGV